MIVIDSVENADEIGRARAQNPVETETQFRRLDFLGIPGADGGDQPTENDARFQVADPVPVLQASTCMSSQSKPSRGSQLASKTP